MDILQQATALHRLLGGRGTVDLLQAPRLVAFRDVMAWRVVMPWGSVDLSARTGRPIQLTGPVRLPAMPRQPRARVVAALALLAPELDLGDFDVAHEAESGWTHLDGRAPPGAVSVYPRRVSVRFLGGALEGFQRSELHHIRTTPPGIDAAQALRLLEAMARADGLTLEGAPRLEESPVTDGVWVTVWKVGTSDQDGASGWSCLDADTGRRFGPDERNTLRASLREAATGAGATATAPATTTAAPSTGTRSTRKRTSSKHSPSKGSTAKPTTRKPATRKPATRKPATRKPATRKPATRERR
ncbi:MAG: hypothetical protein KBG28_30885 [Kofleriaceae bacterium]|nr:hypothetical protein [Kofleriaceae bacterium]